MSFTEHSVHTSKIVTPIPKWLETERTEYLLAQTSLKAGDPIRALKHAQNCLEIIVENHAPPLEFFLGYEILALVEKARNNSVGFSRATYFATLYFEKLSEDNKLLWATNLEVLQSAE